MAYAWRMWERLSRRTMAPGRPMIRYANRTLAAVSVVVLVASAAFALYVVFVA